MPARVLAHEQAPTSKPLPQGMLESPGVWRDVSPQGQFLLDAEFLTRNTAPPPMKTKPTVVADTACVYTTCPSYLKEISQQFPWVHFFAFNCPVSWQTPAAATGEYDPAQPELVTETCPTLQTELNRTTSPYEFSKDSALTLSRTNEADPTRHRLVMICHGETAVRQMVLHVLLRADFSLLDICGPVPAEYLTGELVLPVMLPWNRMFALLVVDRECKGWSYNPETFAEEMGVSSLFLMWVCVCLTSITTGFFQCTMRSTEAYDQGSKDLIISEYARKFWWYHQCDAGSVQYIFREAVDTLRAS